MVTELVQSEIPGVPVKRGKVRDVYDFGSQLLFVATDRISAFDYILPTAIPRKGEVLTRISKFWFEMFDVEHHLISTDISTLPLPDGTNFEQLQHRSMVVTKTEVVPFECVVRGYLAGSGWNEYQTSSAVCGVPLPSGLKQAAQLPEPIFTPATKAEEGHDINVSFDVMAEGVGTQLATELRDLSLQIYAKGAEFARDRGIIIADTKFEFGLLDGKVILIDEVLTPDSSRFWPADHYEPGTSPYSFDKQFVRDWLLNSSWDRNSPPPELPGEIVEKTASRYIEAFETLTGTPF